MGRTYRRNPDDYYSYGSKSLREKRQRGSTRNNWETIDAQKNKKRKNKNWDNNSDYNYENYEYWLWTKLWTKRILILSMSMMIIQSMNFLMIASSNTNNL